jgi:hypothetical protein
MKKLTMMMLLVALALTARADDVMEYYIDGKLVGREVRPSAGNANVTVSETSQPLPQPTPIGSMPVGQLTDNFRGIRIGFTPDQVTAWMGRPNVLKRTIEADRVTDCWTYTAQQSRLRYITITFYNGRVATITFEKAG